jgi:hypothetical protein
MEGVAGNPPEHAVDPAAINDHVETINIIQSQHLSTDQSSSHRLEGSSKRSQSSISQIGPFEHYE